MSWVISTWASESFQLSSFEKRSKRRQIHGRGQEASLWLGERGTYREEPGFTERGRGMLLEVGPMSVNLLGEVGCDGGEGLSDDVEDLSSDEMISTISTVKIYFTLSGSRRR
jgi:hypothetical protein